MSIYAEESLEPSRGQSLFVPVLIGLSPIPQVASQTLTFTEAATRARSILCQLDSRWCTATLEAVATEVCRNPTLFSSTNPDDVAIRCGLSCPLPTQTCPGAPGGGNLTLIAILGLGLIGGLAFYIASRRKKVIIARVERPPARRREEASS